MSWLHANGPLDQHPDSYYAAITPPLAPLPALRGRTEADLCIIGGGLTGLSAAYHAARAGLSVVLLEAARLGWGASGRNGGQVGSGFNWSPQKLAARLGADAARALWDEAQDAKSLVRGLIADHAPEAAYRPGVIHACLDTADLAKERAEADWLADTYGYVSTPLDQDALAARIGSTHYAGGVLDPGAGYCNPLALTLGLARAALTAGAQMHEGSEVTHIRPRADHWRVQTARGQVTARHILHATNGLGTHLTRASAARVLPINNYIAVSERLDTPPMPDPVAVADSRFVVNYFWQTSDNRLVYGGGESYGKGYPRDIAAKVRANLARVYPALRDIRFEHAWGGTLAVTATRLPFIGQPQPGLFTCGGYSGHGLALAPHAGRAVVEAIQGDATRLTRLQSLPTPPLPGGALLGGALTTAAMAWYALRDRLRAAG